MRLRSKIFATLLALTAEANAEVVTVTGYGQDYNQALMHAKMAALEKVVGTFIVSDTVWRTNENVFEQIKQYNGGVIKSYDVIKATEHEVTIKADVDVIKNNKIHVDNNKFDTERMHQTMDNFKQRMDVISYLDDPNKAFHVLTKDVIISPKDRYTTFKVINVVQWQPKWISDLEAYSRNIGDEGKTHTNTKEVVSASVLNNAMTIHPVLAIAGSMVYQKANPAYPQSEDPMVCFAPYRTADIDKCYTVGTQFSKMPTYSDMRMEVKALDINGKQIYKKQFNITVDNMLSQMGTGQKNHLRWGKNRTFDQPTTIIYQGEIEKFAIDINLENSIARQLHTFVIKPV